MDTESDKARAEELQNLKQQHSNPRQNREQYEAGKDIATKILQQPEEDQ